MNRQHMFDLFHLSISLIVALSLLMVGLSELASYQRSMQKKVMVTAMKKFDEVSEK